MLGVTVSGVSHNLNAGVGLPVKVSQHLRPGKDVCIDGSMVLESLSRMEYESAAERGERHGTSMSGLDARDDFLATVGLCDLPDFTR